MPSIAAPSDAGSANHAMQVMDARKSLIEDYFPRINPRNNKAMMDLRRHGICTVLDPRACMNITENTADIACCIYLIVSKEYFESMIKDGYLPNGLFVWLHDTEYDTYCAVVALNVTDPSKDTNPMTAEGIYQKIKHRDELCDSGVDLLVLGRYQFMDRTRNTKRHYADEEPKREINILSSRQFNTMLRREKHRWNCRRDAAQDERRHLLSTCSTGKIQNNDTNMYRESLPIIVVEHPWCLKGTDGDGYDD